VNRKGQAEQNGQRAMGARSPRAFRGGIGLLVTTARTKRGRVAAALILVVLLIAFIGPFVAPYDPNQFVTTTFAKPTAQHWLGGDVIGRDVFSRVLSGGWSLLLLAVAATLLGMIVGTASGVVGAYYPGWADSVVMRTVDIMLAFPQIVFALILMSIVGPKVWLLILAVGLTHAPQVARVIRSAALDICERDFVKAAQAWGIPGRTVMLRSIVPNLVTPLMVEVGLRLSYSIIVISGLAFLGFGTQPPTPDWGRMISENRIGLLSNLWATVAPAVFLGIVGVATNTFADAVARVSLGVEGAEVSVVLDSASRVGLAEATSPSISAE